jgi:hypothetical protein
MKPKSYDQISLLEKVLYYESFGGQDQDTYPRFVPYSVILNIRPTGWICTIDDRMLNPKYYYPAPLAHHLDSIEGTKQAIARQDSELAAPETSINSFSTQYIDDTQPGLPTKKTRSFGGQAGYINVALDDNPTESKWGYYWIEHVYKTVKGVTYGPYRVKRWRDENGRKRSRYLGKVPTETTAPDSPA